LQYVLQQFKIQVSQGANWPNSPVSHQIPWLPQVACDMFMNPRALPTEM